MYSIMTVTTATRIAVRKNVHTIAAAMPTEQLVEDSSVEGEENVGVFDGSEVGFVSTIMVDELSGSAAHKEVIEK